MKLYLSSLRLGHQKARLAAMAKSARFAYIPNALDDMDYDANREEIIKCEIDELAALGLQSDVVNLRDYFTDHAGLRATLAPYQALYVTGGNTFILRRAMRQSALDAYLREKQQDNDFVYVGYSAGACICAPTLRGIEQADNPEVLPAGYQRDIIWDGLSLIDYCIAPHYHPGESTDIDNVVRYFIDNKMLFRALRDGDVIIQE
jgi:dipeptidase E